MDANHMLRLWVVRYDPGRVAADHAVQNIMGFSGSSMVPLKEGFRSKSTGEPAGLDSEAQLCLFDQH